MKTRVNTRQRILEFIRQFLTEKGYAPTVRDIVRGCHMSTTSVVQHHLNKLEEEGYIQRDPTVFRSIRLRDNVRLERQAPLLGTIAAGSPIPVPAADNWTTVPHGSVKLPPALFKSNKTIFALKIKGNSMIDALIEDGDIVLMEPVTSVNNGDMVAVWLKDRQEVTLKKLYRERGLICLKPANQTMRPIYTDPENIELQGRVVGVIRDYSRIK